MPSVSTAETSSGITTSATGDRHIPASVRPDGSTRKEIKIRPGYKPPEDIEVYKNRTAEGWKARGTGGIPGAAVADPKTENKAGNMKNAKRREARKKAKAAEEGTKGDPASEASIAEKRGEPETTIDNTPVASNEISQLSGERPKEQPQPQDQDAEKEKQVRTLKKKLRQARDLKEKKNQGGNLLPEQFEKVIKINELIRQLDSLGFDANGEPK